MNKSQQSSAAAIKKNPLKSEQFQRICTAQKEGFEIKFLILLNFLRANQ